MSSRAAFFSSRKPARVQAALPDASGGSIFDEEKPGAQRSWLLWFKNTSEVNWLKAKRGQRPRHGPDPAQTGPG